MKGTSVVKRNSSGIYRSWCHREFSCDFFWYHQIERFVGWSDVLMNTRVMATVTEIKTAVFDGGSVDR